MKCEEIRNRFNGKEVGAVLENKLFRVKKKLFWKSWLSTLSDRRVDKKILKKLLRNLLYEIKFEIKIRKNGTLKKYEK